MMGGAIPLDAGEGASPMQVAICPRLVPDLEGEDEEEFVRKYWDPCLYRTMSDHWLDRVVQSLRGSSWKEMDAWAHPDVGITGRLFAAWPTADYLRSEMANSEHPGLVGARTPLLHKLGVGTNAMSSDDTESRSNTGLAWG